MSRLFFGPLEILGDPIKDSFGFAWAKASCQPYGGSLVGFTQIARLTRRNNIADSIARIWLVKLIIWRLWNMVLLMENVVNIKKAWRITAISASAMPIVERSLPIGNGKGVRKLLLSIIPLLPSNKRLARALLSVVLAIVLAEFERMFLPITMLVFVQLGLMAQVITALRFPNLVSALDLILANALCFARFALSAITITFRFIFKELIDWQKRAVWMNAGVFRTTSFGVHRLVLEQSGLKRAWYVSLARRVQVSYIHLFRFIHRKANAFKAGGTIARAVVMIELAVRHYYSDVVRQFGIAWRVKVQPIPLNATYDATNHLREYIQVAGNGMAVAINELLGGRFALQERVYPDAGQVEHLPCRRITLVPEQAKLLVVLRLLHHYKPPQMTVWRKSLSINNQDVSEWKRQGGRPPLKVVVLYHMVTKFLGVIADNVNLHSASLSLNLEWASADGEIVRRFGLQSLADRHSIAQIGGIS